MGETIHLSQEEMDRPWEPITPSDALKLFANANFDWWIAGGYAIELFAGEAYREHEDLDILILRKDLEKLHTVLPGWQIFASDPPGKLRPWHAGETLPSYVHDIWVRKNPDSPWEFQIMVNDHDGEDFLYKRDHSIRFPIKTFSKHSKEGIPYLAAELQLLHKAKGLRDKDQVDFSYCLDRLGSNELKWLGEMIAKCYSADHPWINQVN